MADTIDSLKKELEFYRDKFALGENDVAIAGYLAYVNLVKQQVDFIAGFKISTHIEAKKTESLVYERATSMGEGLPEMITKMNKLKVELNVQYDEMEGKPKVGATTPQSLIKRA